MSRSIASIASLVSAPGEVEEHGADPVERSAARSSASMVLAKVGVAGSPAIARSRPGALQGRVEGRPEMLGPDASKGGMPKGVCQSSSSGLPAAASFFGASVMRISGQVSRRI